MRAHSQTIEQRPQVRLTVEVGGLDWFHRLCRWFRALTHSPREIAPVSGYGIWDARRERFQQMRAEAAVDIVAAQSGALWAEKIYGASI
jgi:hypothetical protein